MLVKATPPLLGRSYGLDGEDKDMLILSPKYQDGSLFPISEWPLDVYIFLPLITEIGLQEALEPSEVKKIAFGELCLEDTRRTQPTGPHETNPW
jgi:hypothetical protein